MWLNAPQVTSTLAPTSAVPLTATPAAFSVALTTLSVATALITGRAEAVSTVTLRVPATLALPAASVATALMEVLPSVGRLLKLVLQVPPAVAVTVWEASPQVTTTLEAASAVPLTATPAAFSVALTMLSVATALTTGAVGAVLSKT